MRRARIVQLSALIAMFSIPALAPELDYIGMASAAGVGLAGSKLDIERRGDLTFVDCKSTVRSHCHDIENACNNSGRETVYECRRRYNLCVASSGCLQGSNDPLFPTLPRGGLAEERCIQWVYRGTGRPGCNPSVLPGQCICARRDYPSVEVRAPGSASGGGGGASVRVLPRTHTITGSGLW
jgi:hypothetical protein